ncbi:hypothetical protein BCR33DRAFT_714198 [Rhizoclosmatium globosum]|uniref:CCHC-type domain-containing protein n=1 Tax=Rhizoclosmatium globosum TaxID=329046 RepID=A0A1Y2CQ97_9FUNG|nr:hypothetical protein BCR33DRAFT_714198 [Rhizoclosmatium globosum]|eukprot:ORY49153.1 hypothetical protein BCR33DRAFT_714198 [Rhizoclosmatium globosum]
MTQARPPPPLPQQSSTASTPTPGPATANQRAVYHATASCVDSAATCRERANRQSPCGTCIPIDSSALTPIPTNPTNQTSYNCRTHGHNSRDCSFPRASKSCFRCHAPDHLSRDCPVKYASTNALHRACFSCGGRGHVAKECLAYPLPIPQHHHQHAVFLPFFQQQMQYLPYSHNNSQQQQQLPFQAPLPIDLSNTMCLKCGTVGHVARFCTNPHICWTCKQSGHVANECPQARRCYTCNEIGHSSRSCAYRFDDLSTAVKDLETETETL